MAQRKNAHTITTAESNRYKNAINTMLADIANPYGHLVAIHGDMRHDLREAVCAMGSDSVSRSERAT